MIAMITAAGRIDAESITVESTLMNGNCCRISIHIHEDLNNASQNPFTYESKEGE